VGDGNCAHPAGGRHAFLGIGLVQSIARGRGDEGRRILESSNAGIESGVWYGGGGGGAWMDGWSCVPCFAFRLGILILSWNWFASFFLLCLKVGNFLRGEYHGMWQLFF